MDLKCNKIQFKLLTKIMNMNMKRFQMSIIKIINFSIKCFGRDTNHLLGSLNLISTRMMKYSINLSNKTKKKLEN